MAKPKCPKCLSKDVIVTDIVDSNYKYENRPCYILGRRVIKRSLTVLVSFDRETSFECTSCGHTFTGKETKKVN